MIASTSGFSIAAWSSQQKSFFHASGSPQSQHPPPYDVDILNLCVLCVDFLKQLEHKTHVGSMLHSRQLYVGSPFLKMLPHTDETLLPAFNLVIVSSHFAPRTSSWMMSIMATFAPSSSNVQVPKERRERKTNSDDKNLDTKIFCAIKRRRRRRW